MIRAGLSVLAVIASAHGAGLDDWSMGWDAQYRVRSISDTGLDFMTGDARHNISHRARLGVHLDAPGALELRVMIQDVRLWGEEAHTLNDTRADGLDMREAWVSDEWDALSLKLGRQAFLLDDQRIIGAVNWTQRGRVFDGAVLRYAPAALTVQAFGFRLAESDPRGGDGHIADADRAESDLIGVHLQAPIGDWLTASALAMHVLVEASARTTVGAHLAGKRGGVDYAASYYLQASEAIDASGSAQLIAARLGYTRAALAGLGARIWFDRLGGDGTPTGSFATPFATNHKFYGYMDRFIDTVNDPLALGLMDVGGGVSVTPAGHRIGIDAHVFRSVEPGPGGARHFGTELDARWAWKISPHQSLAVVYGLFLPGDLTEATAGDQLEHLAIVTLDTQR